MTTIERELLEQALKSMCWAARTLNIAPDEAPNYHRSLENIRAALAAPAAAPEPVACALAWKAWQAATDAALERAAEEIVLIDKRHWFSRQSRFAEFLTDAIRALKDSDTC